MQKEFGYCNICKKHLFGYNEYVVKNGKKICLECVEKEKKQNSAENKKDLEDLSEYIKSLFHKKEVPNTWLAFIEKQNKLGRTYSGMQGTLYYFYEILGNYVDYSSLDAIGIIDFMYDEASEYFKNMRSVMKHNSEVKIETKTKIVQSAFVVPKKSNIDIGSL